MGLIKESQVASREDLLIKWYEDAFPVVCGHIKNAGGSLEDAKEVFQEAIVVYYEKKTRAGFIPNKNDESYLIGIAKNLWLQGFKKGIRNISIDNYDSIDSPSDKPVVEKLIRLLKISGEKCMSLLQTFYYQKMSMKDIAADFGYTSERSATVQKYKCLEKVRNVIKEKSLGYEDFID